MKTDGTYAMHGWSEEKQCFIIVILTLKGEHVIVQDIGCELHEKAANAWGRAAVKARGWEHGRESPPDAYARGDIAKD